MTTIVLIARLLLGLVFALSAVTKLRDPRGFAKGVERFGLLPHQVTVVAALMLIALEAVVAAALLAGFAVQAAVPVAAALLVFFVGLMSYNLRRNDPLPCYCFGTGSSEVHPNIVLIRLGLLSMAMLVVLASWFAEGSSLLTQPLAADALLIAVGILLLGGWLLRLPDLREWHQTPVPEFAAPSSRISLRGVPLEVAPRGEEVVG